MVQMDFILPFGIYRLKKIDLFSEQQLIFSSTILWVEGWFYWSYLDSLGPWQSDDGGLTGWDPSWFHSCIWEMVPSVGQPGHAGSSHLEDLTDGGGPHRWLLSSFSSFASLPFLFHFADLSPQGACDMFSFSSPFVTWRMWTLHAFAFFCLTY